MARFVCRNPGPGRQAAVGDMGEQHSGMSVSGAGPRRAEVAAESQGGCRTNLRKVQHSSLRN